MSQSSVDDTMPVAVAGLLADNTMRKNARTGHSEEDSDEIPFGTMVAKGSEDDGVLKLASAADKLAGVVMFGQKYEQGGLELGDTGLKPGCSFDVLRHGTIYVQVEDAVTPASGVHVRWDEDLEADPAEVAGAFRGTADPDKTLDCSTFCKFLTSADAGEFAIVEIDMTNASEATADS